MNERIRQIAIQAGYGTRWTSTEQFEEFMEKFCLLVVDECVEWIDNNGGMIDSDTRDRLIKHFGIKNETENVSST